MAIYKSFGRIPFGTVIARLPTRDLTSAKLSELIPQPPDGNHLFA